MRWILVSMLSLSSFATAATLIPPQHPMVIAFLRTWLEGDTLADRAHALAQIFAAERRESGVQNSSRKLDLMDRALEPKFPTQNDLLIRAERLRASIESDADAKHELIRFLWDHGEEFDELVTAASRYARGCGASLEAEEKDLNARVAMFHTWFR